MRALAEKGSQRIIKFAAVAGLLVLLAKLPKILFTTLSPGIRSARKPYTIGQAEETIAYTKRLVEQGKMTPEEKERLDNVAIKANALYYLITGEQTVAEEKPD